MKIDDLKKIGLKKMKSAGYINSDLDVDLILSEIFSMEREIMLAHGDDVVSDEQLVVFNDLIDRRVSGEPIAYILGRKSFFGNDFYVNKDVLVPRPDSEVLVEVAKEVIPLFKGKVVEVGVGSGAIVITLAKAFPDMSFVGIDVSEKALGVAKKNMESLNVSNLELINCEYLDGLEGEVDLIIANLPYIRSGDIPVLPVTVRDFEPKLALDGGEDGLDCYRELLVQAKEKLSSGGYLFMEMDPEQIEGAKKIVSDSFDAELKVWKDLAGDDRVLEAKRI